MNAATTVVAVFGILGTLSAPFVSNWGLEQRVRLKHKHADEIRRRRERVLAYRNLLDASVLCRKAAGENSVAPRAPTDQLDSLRTTKLALQHVLSARHTVDLVGSKESRVAARALWNAVYHMTTTRWKDADELKDLSLAVGNAEDAFIDAARRDLFAGVTQ